MAFRSTLGTSISLALAVLACAGSSEPPAPEVTAEALPEPTEPGAFSGNRAWEHLEALAAIGPREMGTDATKRARNYIREQIEEGGLEVLETAFQVKRISGEEVTLHNVVASVAGESTDVMIVIAPYDTRGFDGFENLGVNDGTSGVAVALELARLVAREPLPYTVWFAFLEGEQEARGGVASAHTGARALVSMLRQNDALEQLRLSLIVNRVCDPDLRIVRDLGSHRVYRDEFFRVARRLGYDEAFDSASPFGAPDEGQGVLTGSGFNRVVVLADTSFGGDEPPGPYADSADDDLEHCSAGSLAVVGEVANAGLRSIAKRLERIDRFAASPVAEAQALSLQDLATPPQAKEEQPKSEDAQLTPEAPEAAAEDAVAP